MSTADRDYLHRLEWLILAMTGNSVDLVHMCETWLAHASPAMHALAYLLLGSQEKALAALSAGIEETSHDACLLVMRGYLFNVEGNALAALVDFDAALELETDETKREAILRERHKVVFLAN